MKKEKVKLWLKGNEQEECFFPSKAKYDSELSKLHSFLKQAYPKMFTKPYLPMAIGTFETLRQLHPHINEHLLYDYLGKFARGKVYLRTMGFSEGVCRFDIYGKEKGYLRASHKLNALFLLKKITIKHKEDTSDILARVKTIDKELKSRARERKAHSIEVEYNNDKNAANKEKVIELIAGGYSNKSIAASLNINKAFVSRTRKMINS
ncbi:hypothetical protein I3271_00095 [Photobacterium leiognathi]|uniref:ProQ/FINO family protein n=1 Tax=Photobacterium leiognathi TaxID=553611 RepID=UPI001EDE3DDC|nr:ProQ/FINO family protein [Photobacterium leiognathi]MCG3883090.1 hypothetical protein [Photobacterium leiognathi]